MKCSGLDTSPKLLGVFLQYLCRSDSAPSGAELLQGPPSHAVPALHKLLLSPVPCQVPAMWVPFSAAELDAVQTPNLCSPNTTVTVTTGLCTSLAFLVKLRNRCLVQKED